MISIIIPVYNNFVYTKRAIQSIRENTKDYELIIVDNNSEDVTESLRSEKDINYIRLEKNYGFAKACNIGASKAKGDFLLFLNNDVIVTKNWTKLLTKHYRYFTNLGIVGAIGNNISGMQNAFDGNLNFDLNSLALDYFVKKKSELVQKENFNKIRIFPQIRGFCMLMKKDVFLEVKGFDENYIIGNYEDDDICLKVLHCGYINAIIEDCFIYHFGSKTLELIEPNKLKEINLHNEQYFINKWGCNLQEAYSKFAI